MVMIAEGTRSTVPGALLLFTDLAEHSMAMPSVRRRWTPAEVRDLMDESRAWPRYELIAGELVVTPAPGSEHQLAVSELMIELGGYLRRYPIGVAVTSPADLVLQPNTITQPDVFVIPASTRIAGDRLQWSDVKSLLLAIEVLSPSNERQDRVIKRDLYMDADVAEYWIIDIDGRAVERWTPRQERPLIFREQMTWNPADGEPLIIDLPDFFRTVTGKRFIGS